MSTEGKDYHVAHSEFSMWGRDYLVARRSIITGLFAEYSYDCRHIVLLNPQVLFVNVCANGGVCGCKEIEGLYLSGSIFMCDKVVA